jgi:serine protease Do
MRNSIVFFIALLLIAVTFSATDCLSATSGIDSAGFSSEDWGSDTSYLGVDTRDITPDRVSALHLKDERGVEITMVDQDAPAGKAGLKEQDVILTLNGENVQSVEQLRRMVRETPAGRVITLGISRNGQPMTIKVQLSDRKKGFAYSFGPGEKQFSFNMPSLPSLPDFDIPVSIVVARSSARSGLMVENITPQLGDFFGAKNGDGVLIRSVEKGSRAEKAGLRAGDVIVKVNGETIHDTGDFTHTLRSHKETTASIGIIRDKKEQTVTLTLPERKQSELFGESMEIPEINADAQAQLGNLRSELADLKPLTEEATAREMAHVKRDMELAKRQMEQAKRETLQHKGELQEEMREMQREMREYEHRMRKEVEQDVHDATRI